jgi:hypothetical protein
VGYMFTIRPPDNSNGTHEDFDEELEDELAED